MFWFSYSFLLLQVYIVENDCLYVYKNTESNKIPHEFNIVYKQIANPLKRLAEMLPGHNLEVQLEMLGHNHVPERTTRFLHFRNRRPQQNFRLREFVPKAAQEKQNIRTLKQLDIASTETTPQQTPAPTTQPSQQHSFTFPPGFNQVNPVFQQFGRPDFPNRGYMMNNNLEAKALPSSPTWFPKAQGAKYPVRQGEASSEADAKRPIYMKDLKKAFEDFEKRIFEKQKDNALLNILSDPEKASAMEEGKKPLLKKDLWMAMGLKFITGCPNQGQDTKSSTYPVPVGTTRRIVNVDAQPKTTPKCGTMASNPKVLRIMQLLQEGVKVDHSMKPGKDNVQWLQVKIPKQKML